MTRDFEGPPELSVRARGKWRKTERIRSAAAALLAERSFDAITTREVAEGAGVSEATLFRYIGGKHELLMMVYGEQMEELLAQIEREDSQLAVSIRRRGADGHAHLDRIYRLYAARCVFYRRNPGNAAAYLREGFRVEADNTRNISQGDRSIRVSASAISEGQAAGVLDDSVDPNLVAQNCHGIYMHEIERTPVRGYDPDTIWERVRARLGVQLEPLVLPRQGEARTA